jgi:hypothetical protein
MAFGDYFKSARQSFNERLGSQFRSISLKFYSTKTYRNVEGLLAFREIFETLVNQ